MSKMQRHKVVTPIVLLILSVINFALAAPVIPRISEVRVDLVDVVEDVTTAAQKRWNPTDKWWTNAALADGTNPPKSLGSSDSDYRSEQELRHDPRSPMYSNAPPQPSSSSSHDSDLPAMLSDPGPSGSFSSLSSKQTESDPGPSRRPFSSLDSGQSASAHSSSDLGQPTWGVSASDPGPDWPYSSLDSKMTESDPGPSRKRPHSPSGSMQSASAHSSSDLGKPTWGVSASDPGPDWPYSSLDPKMTESDPGPSRKRPHSPSGSMQSTSGYRPSGLEPESSRPYFSSDSTSDPGPSRTPYSPLDSKQTKSDQGPLRTPYSSPSDSAESTSTYRPPDAGPQTPHSPPSPGPLQDESESFLSPLHRGKF